MLTASGGSQSQQIDPRVLEQVQGQLGTQRPSPSEQLDAAREAAAGQGRTGARLPSLTAEEIAVRRQQSRLDLRDILPPSPIEVEYRQRLGDPRLSQFGYDLFAAAQGEAGPLTGAVGGDYVLGVGDELVISFQGATSDTRTTRVDREGRIVVGQLPPVRAAGRTLGAVRAELAAATRRTLLGTDVLVSVGSVRAITVFVGGEVGSPGQYQLTSLADLASALSQAGGVRKTGTLRRVRLARGGSVAEVDLYGLLGIGTPPSVRLQDGDRIIVPVIGDTAAVTGNVARPGIFELRGRTTMSELLAYAGGPVRPRGSRVAISRIAEDGSEIFVRAPTITAEIVAGDAVQVISGSAGGAIGRVLLRGFVANPGPRALTSAPTVRDLVGERQDLRAGTYLPMAVLIRRDAATGARRYIPVDLAAALGPGPAIPLESEDRLYVLSQSNAEFINRASVRRIVLGQPNPLPQCRPLERLEELVRDTQSRRFAVVTRGTFLTAGGEVAAVGAVLAQRTAGAIEEDVRAARDPVTLRDRDDEGEEDERAVAQAAPGELRAERLRPQFEVQRNVGRLDLVYEDPACPDIFQEEPELLPVLIENAVGVGGAVRRPGAYPVAGPVSAATMASLAEGLLPQSEAVVLDVTRASGQTAALERLATPTGGTVPNVVLRPGDDVRFSAAQPQFETGAVLVAGEFRRPGLYTIKKGERLSELIARAGGLTELAYPYGAVFTRQAVREAQQEGFRRTARELNTALLAVAARRETGGEGSLEAASQFVQGLTQVEAPGRIVIEADPRVLALRPDLDTVLEAGDAILMPKRPAYVLALGDLNNPGALQFIGGKTVTEYLREGGGMQSTADDDRIFIVLPNGSAQPVRSSFWRRSNLTPPPGSTIVVPKELDPLFGLSVARDITAIVGQFVSSVATVAILATQ